MFQGLELCGLGGEAHHLIDEFLPPEPEKSPVFRSRIGFLYLHVVQEREILHRIKGQVLPLQVKEIPQYPQVIDRRRTGDAGFGKLRFRIEDMANIPVGEGHPPFLRLRSQKVHAGPAGLQNLPAGKPGPDREKPGELLLPPVFIQQRIKIRRKSRRAHLIV